MHLACESIFLSSQWDAPVSRHNLITSSSGQKSVIVVVEILVVLGNCGSGETCDGSDGTCEAVKPMNTFILL